MALLAAEEEGDDDDNLLESDEIDCIDDCGRSEANCSHLANNALRSCTESVRSLRYTVGATPPNKEYISDF